MLEVITVNSSKCNGLADTPEMDRGKYNSRHELGKPPAMFSPQSMGLLSMASV
jgi:hypothetical protein